MIAYSIVILVAWTGSLFIPFWLCGFEDPHQEYKHQKDTHFLRG